MTLLSPCELFTTEPTIRMEQNIRTEQSVTNKTFLNDFIKYKLLYIS